MTDDTHGGAHAAGPGTGHGDDDHEPTFRDHLISLRTMEPGLQVLTGLMIAQIAVAGLMLLAHGLNTRLIAFSYAGGGPSFTVPLLDYVMSAIFVILAAALVTAGVAFASAAGRLMFLTVLGAIYLIAIFGFFSGDYDAELGLVSSVFTMPLWGWAVIAYPRIYKRRYSPERQNPAVYRTLQVMAAVPLLIDVAVIVLTIMDPAQFGFLLIVLRLPLPFLFYLAGTDWAEIIDASARAIVSRVPARDEASGLFWLTMAVAAASLGLMVTVAGWRVVLFLPFAALGALAIALVLLAARFRDGWPIQFPWAGLALLVIGFGMCIEFAFRQSGGRPGAAVPLVLSCAFAIALVWCRQRGRLAWLAPVFLYGFVLGLVWAFMALPIALPVARPPALIFAVAAGTLLALALLRARASASSGLGAPMRFLFLLNLGLLLVYVLYAVVYEWAQKTGDEIVFVYVGVMFVALVWDILVSGHSITNADSPLFPRRARVFLFFGYVTLIVATLQFWSAVAVTNANDAERFLVKLVGDPEFFVEGGIAGYAPALLITLFLLRLGRWVQRSGAHLAAPSPLPAADHAH
jgi:hypothetical protein